MHLRATVNGVGLWPCTLQSMQESIDQRVLAYHRGLSNWNRFGARFDHHSTQEPPE